MPRYAPTSPNVRTLALLDNKVPFGDTDHEPARQAFNDIAALTTRGHAWLARTTQTQYLRLYDWGAWIAGMPRQAEVKPRRTAIAVMNAGEGIGLSLALDFAEAGYTVFGLVHRDHKPMEEGSIGRLLFIWQQRRAALLSRRAHLAMSDASREFPPLGNVIPLPFAPLSSTSRMKARQTVVAYCKTHSINFHAVVLTPVFASPIRGGPLSDDTTTSSKTATGPPFPTYESEEDELSEWEKPLESDSSEEVVTRSRLARHPESKHHYYEKGPTSARAREGSYVCLSLANQDLVERAFQREVTEQLAVAQMFADLLMPDDKKAKRRPRRSPPFSGSPQKKRSPPPFGPIHTSTHEPLSEIDEEDEIIHHTDFVLDPWTTWTIFELVMVEDGHLWNLVPEIWTKTEPRGGKLVWLTGCGESSFSAASSVHASTDVARGEMGRTLTKELSNLGIHVSVVETSPLDTRACGLANYDPHHPEWDPRTNADSKTNGAIVESYDHQMRRARLLARVSSLWALPDTSCSWIVRKAVEARYPKRTYTLGVDVAVQKAARLLPDSVWELSSWVIYERLGGRMCEGWLMDYDSGRYWTWLPGKGFSMALNALGWIAGWVKEKQD